VFERAGRLEDVVDPIVAETADRPTGESAGRNG
jgi:hypothetical protein